MIFFELPEKWCERLGDRLIWVFIAAYCMIFGTLSAMKFYSFGYYDWDFASDLTVLWNSVHGRFLYYPFLEQNIFGAHLYLIILLILPFYFIFQHPLTLLFLQAAFLGLAAYPLYLFAKTKLPKTASLVVSLVYLLYPCVGFINLFETHFEIYEIFFLFFALYFFEKDRFRPFLAFLVLSLLCKENASFVVFMFGLYALIRRRPVCWVLTPVALGMTWFFVAIKIVIPYFAKDAGLYQEGFIFSVYYKHLGNSIVEMARTIIFHPVAVARYALMPDKILYIFQLFAPVGFLSFFGPLSLLMTAPIFMQNLLSSAFTHSKIYYQYTALLIPFIFSGAVFGLNRFFEDETIFKKRGVLLIFMLAASVVSGFYFKAPQFHLGAYFKAYAIDEEAEVRKELVRLIPKKSATLATFKFLPWLANRRDLSSLHLIATGYRMYTRERYVAPEGLKYALIDFNDTLTLNSFFPHGASANIRSFLESGPWKVAAGAGDIVLFEKNRPGGYLLHETFSQQKIDIPIRVNIDNQIEFLGYNMQEEQLGESRILHLTTFWRRLGVLKEEPAFFVVLLNDAGEVLLEQIHVIGYRVYPPAEWPQDKIAAEHVFVLLKSTVPAGTYQLRGGIIGLRTCKMVSVINEEAVDAFGRFKLGRISLKR
mgnify:CR=1 FL=1